MPHILWVVGNQLESETIIEPTFIYKPRARDGSGLEGKIRAAIQEAPCDILFIHRDAEKEPLEERLREIKKALRNIDHVSVPIVPVRMMEAWLLFDIAAIRHAADNPNSRIRLTLPRVRDLEQVVDPKKQLNDLLCIASEKSGRRLGQFKRDLASRVYLVAEIIRDFSPLRDLQAFSKFEAETLEALSRLQ
jgi:hypothetical protein